MHVCVTCSNVVFQGQRLRRCLRWKEYHGRNWSLGSARRASILLEDSKPVFGKQNLRQVDMAAAFEIMDEIRDTFPSEFSQARQIVRERQSLLDDAEAEANCMIEDARSQAMTIASEQEIVRISQQQADTILADARELERQDPRRCGGLRRRGVRACRAEPRHAAQQRAPLPRPVERQFHQRSLNVHRVKALPNADDLARRRSLL